jgi:hypothetical protein
MWNTANTPGSNDSGASFNLEFAPVDWREKEIVNSMFGELAASRLLSCYAGLP